MIRNYFTDNLFNAITLYLSSMSEVTVKNIYKTIQFSYY